MEKSSSFLFSSISPKLASLAIEDEDVSGSLEKEASLLLMGEQTAGKPRLSESRAIDCSS